MLCVCVPLVDVVGVLCIFEHFIRNRLWHYLILLFLIVAHVVVPVIVALAVVVVFVHILFTFVVALN